MDIDTLQRRQLRQNVLLVISRGVYSERKYATTAERSINADYQKIIQQISFTLDTSASVAQNQNWTKVVKKERLCKEKSTESYIRWIIGIWK